MGFFRVSIKFKSRAAYDAISKLIAKAETTSCFAGYTLSGSPTYGEVHLTIDRGKAANESIALALLFTGDIHRDCGRALFRVE